MNQTQAKLDELTKHRDDTDKRIEELKATLAEEQKLKLRHGDYGFGTNWDCNDADAFVFTHQTSEEKSFYASGMGQINTDPDKHPVLGNIFDDLKAMQEDVTEFEIEGYYDGEVVKFKLTTDGRVLVRFKNNTLYIHKEQLGGHALKLRQMQATLKRRQKC